jgi:hypothetical protein
VRRRKGGVHFAKRSKERRRKGGVHFAKRSKEERGKRDERDLIFKGNFFNLVI